MRRGNKKKGNQLLHRYMYSSSGRVQSKCADQLVDFPFPQPVSSPPLLVQVSEIDEEPWKEEATSVTSTVVYWTLSRRHNLLNSCFK